MTYTEKLEVLNQEIIQGIKELVEKYGVEYNSENFLDLDDGNNNDIQFNLSGDEGYACKINDRVVINQYGHQFNLQFLLLEELTKIVDNYVVSNEMKEKLRIENFFETHVIYEDNFEPEPIEKGEELKYFITQHDGDIVFIPFHLESYTEEDKETVVEIISDKLKEKQITVYDEAGDRKMFVKTIQKIENINGTYILFYVGGGDITFNNDEDFFRTVNGKKGWIHRNEVWCLLND